jgi:hypothetical protein
LIFIGVTIDNILSDSVCNPPVSNTEDSIVTEQTESSYYQKNKSKILVKQRAYQERNKDRIKERRKRYRTANNDKIVAYRLLYAPTQKKLDNRKRIKKYNITPNEYDVMCNKQSGLCAICNKENYKKGRKIELCVDHDHVTGKVRGLLCHRCNHMLGLSRDNAGVLRDAIEYLSNTK